MAVQLYDILIKAVSEELKYQKSDGSFPSGYNGPYNDKETPVRNTSHWIISLLKGYEISKNAAFLSAAEKAIEFLLSESVRPMGAAFWHRKNPEKDFSNGLIGQAWTMESLIYAGEMLDKVELIDVAEEVYLQHYFDYEKAGWKILNVDGSYNDYDYTFNHQLWFAAVGGLLTRTKKVDERITSNVDRFMDKLTDHIELYSDGLIKHRSYKFLVESYRQQLKAKFRSWKISNEKKKYMRMKSVGYHGFNLYAFAMLYTVFPNHSLWDSTIIRKALDYAQSNSFKGSLKDNKYAFPYNPPGFEIGYALQEFNKTTDDEVADWISWQLKECYDFNSNRMIKKAHDPETAAARLYESVRLENYELDID